MPPLASTLLLLATLHAAPEPPVPVLVELFTSEGCSSCPPADAALARLLRDQPVPGARVIALGEHVDYWDELGWKDSFSAPVFTQRQAAYVGRLGLASLYTPQLVVDGRRQALGSDERAAREAVARAAREAHGRVALRIAARSAQGLTLALEAAWPGGVPAEVFLALVEDSATTRVARGENAGRTLAHAAVVRSLSVLGRGAGSFAGTAAVARDDLARAGRAVVFVQEPGGGRVQAAATIELG